ncbi:MAG: PadR family transcriptional regulator [Oscillospiraceae bacterium]|nr:PadR family transcriptional regulator [Oscillospiraceae bacterium]
MLEFIIIGMVLDESLTGYDIKKYIEKGIGSFYKASYGSLYPSLKKLTEKDYLIMTEQPQSGRQKKYYKITEKGKEAFFEWLSNPADLNDNMNNHLVKVYFFDKLPEDIRNRHLQEYELKNLNYLRKLQALEKHFSKMENKECFYYKLSTLYYGICIVQDNIKWCRHIRERKPLTELITIEREK